MAPQASMLEFSRNPIAPPRIEETPIRRILLALCVVVSLIALAGCSSNHPVTKTGEACASCHSDGRVAAADPDVSAATETGLTFAIDSNADEVLLCTASIADDGTIVPSRMETIRPDGFDAVAVSRPGLYALCTGEISNPNTVLINASENGPRDATVKL